MCRAKTNRESYVRLDLNLIEQLLDELWQSNGDRSVQFRILDSFRVKNGRGFPRPLCCVTRFQFDLVMRQLLLQERVMSVLDEFNSSELIKTRTRYPFSSEKLVIFENDPLSKHWRIA